MAEVGIRQLRDNLSRYLDQVRDGSEVTITDHGRAIAQIIPLNRPRRLDQMIADGLVTPANSNHRVLPSRRVETSEPVSPLVADQRR